MSGPAVITRPDAAELSPTVIANAVGQGDWKTRALLRAVCRRSFYYHVKVVTCWDEPVNLMDVDTFLPSCDFIQRVATISKRGLFQDPRGHMKSTRATRGLPPWLALQYPDERYDFPEEFDRAMAFIQKHPHLRGADSRLVIGSDSKERAAAFVGSTKTDWETNTILRYIAPEFLWENYNRLPYGEWSRSGYVLNSRRMKSLTDPYVTAVGLDSKSQGGRAEGIIIDDLVGETSYKSPTELKRRKDWLKTVGYLLENRDPDHAQGGFIMVVGNRWSLDDVNSLIHDEMGRWDIWHRAAFRCFIHGAGNCGRQKSDEPSDCALTDEPLWKGRYPNAESLARVRDDVGEEQFCAQFLNDPTAISELDASAFHNFHLDIKAVDPGNGSPLRRKWCVVVPAVGADAGSGAAPGEVIPLESLSGHLISVDPATSKDKSSARTALSWFAFDKPTGRVFWLDCRAGHWDADESVAACYDLYVDIVDKLGDRPRVIVEKVAAQDYFASSLRWYAGAKGNARVDAPPEPEMLPPAHGEAKNDRIRRRTGNRLNQGLLYLRSQLQLPLYEARHFPTGSKDALDTHAQAEEIYLDMQGSMSSNKRSAARQRKRRQRVLAANSTGVSI